MAGAVVSPALTLMGDEDRMAASTLMQALPSTDRSRMLRVGAAAGRGGQGMRLEVWICGAEGVGRTGSRGT